MLFPGILLILLGIVLGTSKEAKTDIIPDLLEGKWNYALFLLVFFSFLLVFFSFLLVRVSHPEIYGNGQKFMNHAFIASIMRAPIVPPLDPWFAGGAINMYYYLGHWCFAIKSLIAGIPSWISFQFMVPTIAAISAVQLYGVGKLLIKRFCLLPAICLFTPSLALIYYLTRSDPGV